MVRVSVIIPCYNSEQWIKKAIDSCINQTYENVEIIVVDDGSTDNSLEIIKSYGERLRWESGPNLGACTARNRGFALSTGNFIQFLDADDYLLSTKIQEQVDFLQSNPVDIVYSDWQHESNFVDGLSIVDSPRIMGKPDDLLLSLLGSWWVAPVAFLYKRHVVEKIKWNEKLSAAQDRDFFLNLVWSGVEVGYLPGCTSVYRRHYTGSITTSHPLNLIKNHAIVLSGFGARLLQRGEVSKAYRDVIAASFLRLARAVYPLDKQLYRNLLKNAKSYSNDMYSDSAIFYKFFSRLFGNEIADWIALFIRKFRSDFRT